MEGDIEAGNAVVALQHSIRLKPLIFQQNVAPSVDQIEITPANYKFPDPVPPLTASSPADLQSPPARVSSDSKVNPPTSGSTITPAMTYSKGAIGVRWAASDENGDTLIYKVEIRGLKEQTWIALKDKVRREVLFVRFDRLSLTGNTRFGLPRRTLPRILRRTLLRRRKKAILSQSTIRPRGSPI